MRYIIKQPNGKYAIWSIIADDFIAYGYTKEQVIESMAHEAAVEAREKAEKELDAIQRTGTSCYGANDWDGAIELLAELNGEHYAKNTVKEILGDG